MSDAPTMQGWNPTWPLPWKVEDQMGTLYRGVKIRAANDEVVIEWHFVALPNHRNLADQIVAAVNTKIE